MLFSIKSYFEGTKIIVRRLIVSEVGYPAPFNSHFKGTKIILRSSTESIVSCSTIPHLTGITKDMKLCHTVSKAGKHGERNRNMLQCRKSSQPCTPQHLHLSRKLIIISIQRLQCHFHTKITWCSGQEAGMVE